jgi:type VI secretion system secreted protein Hcp
MAVDQFIAFKGTIKGETKDDKMKADGAIDVLAWSWGLSQSGTFHTGGGGGAGRVSMQDLSFTHYIDKASAALQMHCATGKHIDEATVTVRKAGGKQEPYLKITMSPCIVTSVSTGGSGGEDRLTENVSLNFGKVKVEYFLQDDKGAVKSGGEYTYDMQANKKV